MNLAIAAKFKAIEQQVLADIQAAAAKHGMRAWVSVHEKYPAPEHSVSTLAITAHIYE